MYLIRMNREHTRLLIAFGVFFAMCATSFAVFSVPNCSVSSFAPARLYGTVLPPYPITTGDFNGDGRPDIVTGSTPDFQNQGGISILLNDGAGGFGEASFYPTGQLQEDVVTGDFNNDSKLDVAVPNWFSNTVSILLGNGDGTFNQAINSTTGGTFPNYLATGDINHDGMLDLIVDNAPVSATGNISIMWGDGTGHFTITTPITSQTGFMRAADFDGDGNLDIVGVTNQLRYYLGNINGSFSQQPDVNTGLPVTSFAINDLNRDNKPDIVAVSGTDAISVVLNNGNGTFSPPTIYHISVVRVGSYVATGDVNGDGLVDIALTNHDSVGRVHVLLGNGTGSFTLTASYPTITQSPLWIAMADFNGNGRADIVTENDKFNLSVFLSTCLSPTPRYDFDGDGKSDIGVYRPTSGVWYELRSSDNSFLAQQWGLSTDRIVAADYDGDSKTDLAVYRPSAGAWFILRSTNNTFIAPAFGLSTDVPVPADYDADGKADLAVYRDGAWYIQRSSDNVVIAQSFGTATDKPMPADYDRDGKADIAVFRPADGTWYMQQSMTGSFRAQPFGTSNDVPVTGDFDGDGKADVAVYRPASGTWYVLKSSNSSLLAQRWGVETDLPVAADYDGDGKTDLAVFRPSNGTWYIVRSSDAAFTSQQFGIASDVPLTATYLAP